MTERKLIFITNDDGVTAPGIRHLTSLVKDYADIIVVAPDGPRSGQASAITVETPLRIKEIEKSDGISIYSVNGTPVDCVKLGMHAIVPRRPDLLLSGINHGSNAGNCVVYSGTMGAAIEGCLIGIPSIGFSMLSHSWKADFTPCDRIVKAIVKSVLSNGLPQDVCLNVNIPAGCTPQGLKVVRAASGHWTEEYREYQSPGGRPFYMLTGQFVNHEPDSDETDEYWLKRDYATLVPVKPDPTATHIIQGMYPFEKLYSVDDNE